MLTVCCWSPTSRRAPVSRRCTSALAPEVVVLLMVTGMVTVSPGLMNLGSAELSTIGSATVMVVSFEPKLSFL